MRILVSIFIFSFLSALGAAETLQSTPKQSDTVTATTKSRKSAEQRLQELEHRLREFDEWYNEFYINSKSRVSPFLGEKISLGGYFETSIVHLGGPDMETQTSTNAHILAINLAADFNENIRFVTQFLQEISYSVRNIHNNPGLTPSQRQFAGPPFFGSLVAQAFLEMRKSELLVMQAGLGYVPFGIAFQQRELILFKRRGGPQLLAASDATSIGIAFPLWTGVHVSGSTSMESGRAGYHLYTFSPTSNPKTIGIGARGWWADQQSSTYGISLQSVDQAARGYFNSYGFDYKYEGEKYGLVAEYAKSKSSGEKDVESYYIEPYVNLDEGEWVLYAAADYVNNPNRLVGTVADPYEVWRYGGGVNWLPMPNARVRAGVFRNDYLNSTDTIAGQQRDFYVIDLSVGVAF